MLRFIRYKNPAAKIPPSKGEITQLAAILPMVPQLTISNPEAATPAPRTAPTIECVVETGAPTAVAKLSQIAPASKADIINQTKLSPGKCPGLIIPLRIVLTTSPPASIAPIASKIAAINSAPPKVSALEPTA